MASIIGAGPAGMMAAARAAERGKRSLLIEKNREPGAKILLSGGSRCNLAPADGPCGVVEAFGPAGRFLHSALAAFGPRQAVEMFEAEGVPTKVEPNGKIFPASDRAADVRAALMRRVKRAGCVLAPAEPLLDVKRNETTGVFQLTTADRMIESANLVLATGGRSYPSCGTTGDGYRWAAALGHRVVPPRAALVPITSHAAWVTALQGVTLPDVAVEVVDPSEAESPPLAAGRGAMLFAHFGVSGPVVLNVSHAVSGHGRPASLLLRCNLLPAMKEPEFDALLARELAAPGRRRAGTLLDRWLPHRVGLTLLELADVSPEAPLGEFSKARRRRLAQLVRRLDVPVSGTMGFRKAEVTAGGIPLDEVDSRSMRSRIVPNLYFAGELLDLNGPEGGYNFMAAFCTGRLAGDSV